MGKIRIKHDNNEIEIDGSDEFIEKHLNEFYNRIGTIAIPSSKVKKKILEEPVRTQRDRVPSPAEYYQSRAKKDRISRILILAKYLEQYRNVTIFSPEDINKLGKEIKLSKDIHGQYFTNAVKQGLLRSHGRSQYSLTLSAESILSSM